MQYARLLSVILAALHRPELVPDVKVMVRATTLFESMIKTEYLEMGGGTGTFHIAAIKTSEVSSLSLCIILSMILSSTRRARTGDLFMISIFQADSEKDKLCGVLSLTHPCTHSCQTYLSSFPAFVMIWLYFMFMDKMLSWTSAKKVWSFYTVAPLKECYLLIEDYSLSLHSVVSVNMQYAMAASELPGCYSSDFIIGCSLSMSENLGPWTSFAVLFRKGSLPLLLLTTL
ncbi:hypothetical protein OPV22_009350 [Ensete ventricosum]|uniref:Uncharacterized protein n=1 Tax=Ensete ventricosum TaxID=4639 RepID=A0AAV8RFR0_ENSVE|nr:hypothetical protein OPV22_009350 [Ensete ventricosum]